MSAPSSSADRDPLDRLAEEFVARLRRGERPSVNEYADCLPDRAEEIRELFPALVEMEQLKPVTGDLTTSTASDPLDVWIREETTRHMHLWDAATGQEFSLGGASRLSFSDPPVPDVARERLGIPAKP